MLATVLKSKTAVEVTKQIMRTFSKMKSFLQNNSHIFQRFERIEYHIGASLKDLGKKVFGFNKIDAKLIMESIDE
ncbi:hypothetical protein ACMCNP_04805 [Candidatus Acidulodesulfobacterium sp. H_13]|uniref:hypothetical protein n=1 Tax=Candidatus Acidulodesulfobacterium sp. H_13 TaxID=3395470 RepID=UPI003AF66FBA